MLHTGPGSFESVFQLYRSSTDEYWPAQGFVAAGLGLALIPVLALGVQHPGVAIRRIQQADQPERQVLAVTRAAISSTLPVRTMITALQSQANHQLPR